MLLRSDWRDMLTVVIHLQPTATLMLVTDVGDKICWQQICDDGAHWMFVVDQLILRIPTLDRNRFYFESFINCQSWILKFPSRLINCFEFWPTDIFKPKVCLHPGSLDRHQRSFFHEINDAVGCPEIPGLLDKSWQNIKTWNLDDVIRTGKRAFSKIVALRNYPRFCPWTIIQPKITWFPVHAIIDFGRIWISNLLFCSLAPPQEYLPFSTRNSNSNFTSFTATSIALGKIETFFRILRTINSEKPTECVRRTLAWISGHI